MMRFLIPAVSAAILSLASVSAANADAWGAYYPQGAHNQAGDQSKNSRSDGWGSGKGYKSGNGGNKGNGGWGRGSGGWSGGSGGWGGGSGGGSGGSGGGEGISRSAPGPVLGVGLPALVVAGGYVFFRRRARKQ